MGGSVLAQERPGGPDGVTESESPSWRFVRFAEHPSEPIKILLYVALKPEDLPAAYRVLATVLNEACVAHRLLRTSESRTEEATSPAWIGKTLTLYLPSENLDLVASLDARLAASGCSAGPAPTVRCQLVGPASGMLFSRSLSGAPDETAALRRRKLSDLLEWTGEST